MIKLVTIIGARPQIIKAAALNREIQKNFSGKISEYIVHTGQHYDKNMSNVFFDELMIPNPDINLNVGSGNHGNQTALMIKGIEKVLYKQKPDFLIVYGDTNSTLAGAIAASKIHVPVIHIEAGLRSFNKSMPEEINRIMCDHVSTLLFSPTKTACENLFTEGFEPNTKPPFSIDNPHVFHCGDIMYDNSLFFSIIADGKSDIIEKLELRAGEFVLVTIHRDNNTDNPERLNSIFEAINDISITEKKTFVLPLHPRTAKLLQTNIDKNLYKSIDNNPFLKILPPVSFLDMIVLEKNSQLIITDSGGVQKESYFFKKPCIILRPQTEWKEIVENGTAIIADADKNKILDAYSYFTKNQALKYPSIFGDGNAAGFICKEIIKQTLAKNVKNESHHS